MYRSFLKCDDPKGVVGCGTIRKYRTRSHKGKDKTKMQKTSDIMETSLINKRYKEEKKVAKECDGNLVGPSSLQLTKVSEEDHSLTNMLDSWSRDIICEGKSEDIAKGILKGALGLQDSLSMLRKLQEEVAQHTAPFGRKQTEKPERDRIDGNKIGIRQANPLGEQSNTKGFQRSQLSAGGSSSNCKEELKKVIKESLVRQNMFPKTSDGFNSGSETFHISTSQCFGVKNDRLSDPSSSVIASRIEKGPSLVFKLMGLEEGPSKSFPAAKQKLLGGEIDKSKVRNNDSTDEKVNPELKVVRETLETTHFKGIFKENFVKDSKHHVHHHFNDTSSKQFVDLSHISSTEPQCTIYQQSEKSAYIPVLPKELRKLRREILSSKTIKHRKGSSSTNMGKEMEKGIRKRLKKEGGPKFLKEVTKVDAKGNNPVEEYAGKVKLYCHIGHTSHVNETIDRKWKVRPISRKQTEKDISQPTIVAEHQYKREIPSTKLRKLKSGSRIDKNEISCLKSRGSNNISTKKTTNSKDVKVENKKVNSVVDSITGRKNQMKKQSPVAEPELANLTVSLPFILCIYINQIMK
ncbi:uncharacterized protein LOC124838393 [Vigna umbellata]|uniref:uncharacterized protein LOC124838393 n=1 Tax=Vigna umbellata TaxID=87088 RepID=UPI001F5F3AC0|nr:uncharacterized protein LOC124838393 [Vigna umbellata]XP_047169945.1 uncharacterized protein LOC124838393 [Vigna umbellata]